MKKLCFPVFCFGLLVAFFVAINVSASFLHRDQIVEIFTGEVTFSFMHDGNHTLTLKRAPRSSLLNSNNDRGEAPTFERGHFLLNRGRLDPDAEDEDIMVFLRIVILDSVLKGVIVATSGDHLLPFDLVICKNPMVLEIEDYSYYDTDSGSRPSSKNKASTQQQIEHQRKQQIDSEVLVAYASNHSIVSNDVFIPLGIDEVDTPDATGDYNVRNMHDAYYVKLIGFSRRLLIYEDQFVLGRGENQDEDEDEEDEDTNVDWKEKSENRKAEDGDDNNKNGNHHHRHQKSKNKAVASSAALLEINKLNRRIPSNTSMGIHFVILPENKTNTMGVWVKRKPPIPDFMLEILKDNERAMLVPFSDVHPAGMGVTNCLNLTIAEYQAAQTIFTVRVIFEEIPRPYFSLFEVKNAVDLVSTLTAYDGAEHVFHSPSDVRLSRDPPPRYVSRRAELLGLSLSTGIDVKLQYFSETNMIALMLIYGHRAEQSAIRNVQVHVVDGNNETIFLEEEYYVPLPEREGISSSKVKGKTMMERDSASADIYTSSGKATIEEPKPTSRLVSISEQDLPFGWYHVIPARQSFFRNRFSIFVAYDIFKDEELKSGGPICDVLSKWLEIQGGLNLSTHLEVRPNKVGALRLFAKGGSHYDGEERKAGKSERTKRRVFFRPKERIASIPYSALVSHQVAERIGFIKDITLHESWLTVEKKYMLFSSSLRSFANDEAQLFRLTCFLMTLPENALDGTKWHLYFQSIPKVQHERTGGFNGNSIFFPVLNASDIAPLLQPISKLFFNQIVRQKAMIAEEYQVACVVHPWFQKRFTEEEFFISRLVVGARALRSVDGHLFLAPLYDFAAHHGSPSATLVADNDADLLHLVARQALLDGEAEITLDYGSRTRTKIEFFMNFGFVPASALDSADVDGVVLTVNEKQSRDLLLQFYSNEEDQEKKKVAPTRSSSSGMFLSNKAEKKRVLKKFKTSLEERLKALPWDVPAAGSQQGRFVSVSIGRILAGVRSTLERHLDWVKADLEYLEPESSDEL